MKLRTMQVFCFSGLDQLAPYADDWDRLSAGVPFRSWTWLSAWWRHYGRAQGGSPGTRSQVAGIASLSLAPHRRDGGPRLLVLGVFDSDDTLVGLAPWYLDGGGPSGRVVRLLGSGEVCSDYLSLLCQPGMEDRVAQAVADHLSELAAAENHQPLRWDLLRLESIDAHDRAADRLIAHLAERGNTVHRRAGPTCWRIELPPTWADYLATLSKSHRKQLRRLKRNLLDSGRAVLHSVRQTGELPQAIDLLVDLHQRRRRALGEPGCFASPRFTAFHREVMPQLFREGRLQLHWLELDGKPVAVEYHLAGGGIVYAYQSGIDPDALDRQPGRLITLAVLRRAIEQGYRALDFLRGDEPYKAHYRARPRPSFTVRVVPDRTAAQLRHGLWLAGSNVKRWMKRACGRGATG
jgi:CelD/BcsL family acetyltransferase involved in cellulose biosynthesis